MVEDEELASFLYMKFKLSIVDAMQFSKLYRLQMKSMGEEYDKKVLNFIAEINNFLNEANKEIFAEDLYLILLTLCVNNIIETEVEFDTEEELKKWKGMYG